MKMITNLFLILMMASLLVSCDFVDKVKMKAEKIDRYEVAAFNLAKENRELQSKIAQLEFDIQTLKSKNSFLTIQLEQKGKKSGRHIASVSPVKGKSDLVKFSTYKWSRSQLLAIAEKEFEKKNYEKSAQFFETYLMQYPKDPQINDRFLYQAGVAAYESGKHHDWALGSMTRLIKEYPASPYYRGAKLWSALTRLKLGEKDQFFNTVEEFRRKYRNTSEWKILSAHYEEILRKYKK